MPDNLTAQLDEMRRRRREQLDQILANAASRASNFQPVPFQPVGMPQAQGSKLVGYFLGPLQGQAPQPTSPVLTSPGASEVSAAQMTYTIPGKGGAAPYSSVSGTPYGKPLSPAPKPPNLLQKVGGAAQQRIQNNPLYKAISALFL